MTVQQVISRIAPTPSGFLHIGNALNFLVTHQYVRKHGGKLILRIDDGDSTRSRPQFIEDIFRTLEWLNIDWDLGPTGPDDFHTNYSQSKNIDKYFSVLSDINGTYNCQCSRKIIRKTFGSTIYRGSCRQKSTQFVAGETAKRIIVDGIFVDQGKEHDLAREMGDFVLWTKDNTPAYQLVSLVEDELHGVTHIFRGDDLHFSTLAQKYLAEAIGYSQFLKTHFMHHGLLRDAEGNKLAKSADSASLKDFRESGRSLEDLMTLLEPHLAPIRTSLKL